MNLYQYRSNSGAIRPHQKIGCQVFIYSRQTIDFLSLSAQKADAKAAGEPAVDMVYRSLRENF
jgi:hypothetical protein